MFRPLRAIDPSLTLLPCGDGTLAMANGLQGRVFGELNGEMLHRFDAGLAATPAPDAFNNLGGNSLWPGPEGGPFAFNYLPGTDWLVQPAINRQKTQALEASATRMACGKRIRLQNRHDATLELDYRRLVMPMDITGIARPFGLKAMAYRCLDELHAISPMPITEALFCAWSLEQFPGGEGVVAFGTTSGDAAQAINSDYYGDPGSRLSRKDHCFRLALGGKDRFQIGINHRCRPELIGAWDHQRSLLIIRRSWRQDGGIYFNIADNDQPRGPFAAADAFSIFNGGELDFFELETIAPLQCDVSGRGSSSTLWSETLFFQGRPQQLSRCLAEAFLLPATFIEGRSS